MKIIADICVIPLNTAKASVREEVAIAHQILLDTGCSCIYNPMEPTLKVIMTSL